MKAIIGSYKGHPTITLARDEQDKYPFSFGLAKARLILEHWEEIKAFVEVFEETPAPSIEVKGLTAVK